MICPFQVTVNTKGKKSIFLLIELFIKRDTYII